MAHSAEDTLQKTQKQSVVVDAGGNSLQILCKKSEMHKTQNCGMNISNIEGDTSWNESKQD